ncbi:hypothetical protein [Sphingopyxis indica]|nr:hypothetical protein [Sphingopyxis indica]
MSDTQPAGTPDPDRWSALADYHGLFAGGPPRRLTALVALPVPICRTGGSRLLLVLMLGWVPLALLTMLAPGVRTAAESFAHDFGAHARLAIAAPLLVLGYSVCASRLGLIAVHFLHSGLLDEEAETRFVSALAAIRARIDSLWAEGATILIAYAAVGALYLGDASLFMQSAWQRGAGGAGLSLAGWWNLLVAMPLLVVLFLGWIWRIALWTHFLRIVAGLDLRLNAAHPDQAAGLGFLTQSVRAFAVLAMALGAVSAGRFAQVYAAGETTQYTNGLLIGGTVALSLLLFIGPLTVFSAPLMRCWRNGTMAYGALACELGRQFENRWFAPARKTGADILDEPDFSAAADLYGTVSNVYAMRFLPVDLRSVLMLLGAALLPFVPAMFLSLPLGVVLGELKGLLF